MGNRSTARAVVVFVPTRLAPALLVVSLLWVAHATGQSLSELEQEVDNISSQLDRLETAYTPNEQQSQFSETYRLADARQMFLLGDYGRASMVFLELVENSANRNSPTFRDARFYLGECLFFSRNYLAARSFYTEVLDDRRDPHRIDAVRRLLEISFLTRRHEGVEDLYRILRSEPEARGRSDVIYVSGKSLYFREDYAGAINTFSDVSPAAEEYIQAQYFLGVSYVQVDQLDRAVNAFETARDAAETSEHAQASEIAELAKLALARVHYEQDDVELARDAYQTVSRTSDHYDRALYEMGWTYIREERFQDALRILEILTMAVPDSRFGPHAQLLRGDLLLRMQRYQNALDIFDSTVQQFTPIAEQLSLAIRDDARPDEYFESLVDSASASLSLPDLAREWIEDSEDMSRALDLARDISIQRTEIRDSQELVADLDAVLSSSSRIDAFPELREGYGRALELQHRGLGVAGALIDAEAGQVLRGASDVLRADYEVIREQRQRLWREIEAQPTTYQEMVSQERAVESDIQVLEMEIFRLGYEVETQQAQLRALRLQVREEHAAGDRSTSELRAANEQLDLFEEGLTALDGERDRLRAELERERLATGLGSVAAVGQEDLPERYLGLIRREQNALATMRGGLDANGAALVGEVDRVRGRLDNFFGSLRRFFNEVDRTVDNQTADIRRQIDVERARLTDYSRQLDDYGDRGERLAGEVAYQNFIDVQTQFNELILRADVGIIDVAWREKEDRTTRIESLFDQRNEQVNLLDAEFQEVLDID